MMLGTHHQRFEAGAGMNTSIVRARSSRDIGCMCAVVLATSVLGGAVSVTPARADDCPVTYSGYYVGGIYSNLFGPGPADLSIDFDENAVSGDWDGALFTGTFDCGEFTMDF